MSKFILTQIAAIVLLSAIAAAQPPDVQVIGRTAQLTQHSGSMGRMMVQETNGWRQFVWTWSDTDFVLRHVKWNGIDPNEIQIFPGYGINVESSYRAGYVTMDVFPNGAGMPGFHNIINSPSNLPQTAISVDLIPHGGAFLDFQAPIAPNPQTIWPMMQIGQNGRIHIISTVNSENPITTHWYISGTYNPATFSITYYPPWTFVDSTSINLVDVATSQVTNKLAAAWARHSILAGTDLYYLIDADGLNPNFTQALNLTQFIPPDPSLLPDTTAANRDTFRLHSDVSLLFDQNDNLHVAFTTKPYYNFGHHGPVPVNAAIIWHWSSQFPDSIRMIAKVWNPQDTVYCGDGNRIIQRPSLGIASNGNLYCIYQQFDTDTMHLSYRGYPSGEIYASVSTDAGLNWSIGIDVTNTIAPYHAPPGLINSEICPSMAKQVNTFCHMQYIRNNWNHYDYNLVFYQRVPVAVIPTVPHIIQNVPFHVSAPPQPPVEIIMTPINPPINIPANGGSFDFNASVVRNTPPQAPITVGTRDRLPNGTYTGYLLGPVTINPPVGVSVMRQRTQVVPGSWQAGVHWYIGYALSFPALDADSFAWTKLADADGGPWITEAACTGELFPGEENFILHPSSFILCEAKPNPFNATTVISYELRAASHVRLKVCDTAGRLVAELLNGWREAGSHEVIFDGKELASGVYLYRMEAGKEKAEGKVVLLK